MWTQNYIHFSRELHKCYEINAFMVFILGKNELQRPPVVIFKQNSVIWICILVDVFAPVVIPQAVIEFCRGIVLKLFKTNYFWQWQISSAVYRVFCLSVCKLYITVSDQIQPFSGLRFIQSFRSNAKNCKWQRRWWGSEVLPLRILPNFFSTRIHSSNGTLF